MLGRPTRIYPSFEMNERDRFLRSMFRFVAVGIVLGSSVAIAIWAFGFGRIIATTSPPMSASTQQLLKLQADLAKVQETLEVMQHSGVSQRDFTSGEFQLLQADVRRLESSQQAINAALLADPVKALQVPLILRDIEAIKQSQAQSLAAVQQDVGRLYAITGGAITFMLTMIVPLIIGRLSERKLDKQSGTPSGS